MYDVKQGMHKKRGKGQNFRKLKFPLFYLVNKEIQSRKYNFFEFLHSFLLLKIRSINKFDREMKPSHLAVNFEFRTC